MRRFLFIALLFSSLFAHSQVYKYNATEFSVRVAERGYWGEWSEWEPVKILIVLNLEKERIEIYSKTPQEYDIVEVLGTESDEKDGDSIRFLCVDEDGLRCNIRIRVQLDGTKQLYVDYKDAMWVYNISKR